MTDSSAAQPDSTAEPSSTVTPAGVDPARGVPALVVEDLVVSFDYPRPAVSGVSLSVERGQIVALVGESGSGKTMTARAAIGLLPDGASAQGSVKVDGVEVLGVAEKELNAIRGSKVAMIFQEPQTALNPVRTVGWQLQQALRAHGPVSRTRARERAVELLTLVELPDPQTRVDYYPHQLSGGQRQRVVIALALAGEPVLLLADEPTTALDVSVQEEILSLLVRLRDRLGTGVLLITHNLGVVADIADQVVVVQLGEVVERGDVFDIFAAPTHAYTRQLLAAVPRLPRAESGAAQSEPGSADALVAGPEDGERDHSSPDEAVRVRNLTVRFGGGLHRGGHIALDAVSLHVRRGEVVGLVGESGSGKTTLGRAVGGLVPIAGGTIELAGTDITELRGRRLRAARRRVSFVPQDPAASLDPRFTVGESIREPLDIQGVGGRTSRRRRVLELLDAVRLPESFAPRLPHELSGGQRQRVALARALAVDPDLLIADEPTSALDVSVQARVLDLFAALQHDIGFAALFISHDLAVVEQVCDRVVVLRAGRVVESGDARAVLTDPTADYTRALIDAVPYPDPVRQRARRRGSAQPV